MSQHGTLSEINCSPPVIFGILLWVIIKQEHMVRRLPSISISKSRNWRDTPVTTKSRTRKLLSSDGRDDSGILALISHSSCSGSLCGSFAGIGQAAPSKLVLSCVVYRSRKGGDPTLFSRITRTGLIRVGCRRGNEQLGKGRDTPLTENRVSLTSGTCFQSGSQNGKQSAEAMQSSRDPILLHGTGIMGCACAV